MWKQGKPFLPILYRVHEGPSEERLEGLRSFLGELGLDLSGGPKPTPLDYQHLLQQVAERSLEANIAAGRAGQDRPRLEAFDEVRNNRAAFDEGSCQRQPEIHHRCDHGIQWLRRKAGVKETVGLEIQLALWMMQEIAVLNVRDRCAGRGSNGELVMLAAFSRFESRHVREAE